jgi:hypothetical protein
LLNAGQRNDGHADASNVRSKSDLICLSNAKGSRAAWRASADSFFVDMGHLRGQRLNRRLDTA